MPRDSHGRPVVPPPRPAPVAPEGKTPEPIEKKHGEPNYDRKRH